MDKTMRVYFRESGEFFNYFQLKHYYSVLVKVTHYSIFLLQLRMQYIPLKEQVSNRILGGNKGAKSKVCIVYLMPNNANTLAGPVYFHDKPIISACAKDFNY